MHKRKLISSCGVLSTLLTGCSQNEAGSIAIIGGADGPTTIYLASSSANFWMIQGVIVMGISIAAVIFFLKKRK